MKISRLSLQNFRGIKNADLSFEGHTLLVGANNVGKSTICEALELALGPDRQRRSPVVEEFDFYNAAYLDVNEEPIEIRIEVLMTDVTPTIEKACRSYLERWDPEKDRYLTQGEIDQVDAPGNVWCLHLLTIARYNKEEDEFEAATHYAHAYDPEDEKNSLVPRTIKRNFGFLYLRTLRTGSRALSLERGSLLDIILRIKSLQTGIWEHVRRRLETLNPPIEDDTTNLTPVLQTIEARLAEYISIDKPGEATRLFVSQLTREHLRKTLSFFISVTKDQKPVPFQDVGTGTLNTLVLALLSFIAELKEENVIFAMEEPEIALAPHTQRRIATYLLTKTTQCFVTSHSPYIIETFNPRQILILRRDENATVKGTQITLGSTVKTKTYRRYLRRGIAEAMLGKGVIIVEGITEQIVLKAVAEKLEEDDSDKYPLDLSGITIITTDGDGSIHEFGQFFHSLDLPTFAFFDKKRRSETEREALNDAQFEILNEIPYAGMEDLLIRELPLKHQWTYLEHIRDNDIAPKIGIPFEQPIDTKICELTRKVLKDGKGWGRAAELIDLCSVIELPITIVSFLEQIYIRFPKPKIPDINTANDSPPINPDEDADVFFTPDTDPMEEK